MAMASRSARICRRASSRWARSRGDEHSAVGTSHPELYLSSYRLLAVALMAGGSGTPAGSCGGVKVRKPWGDS
eukprot:scaffold1452_cov117-Isochrysis_galbana.AAC.7